MCGRFTLTTSPEALAGQFHLDSVPSLPPRFNIAPTQAVAVVRVRPGRPDRELAILQWGLIPSWTEDPSIGSRLINARAEGLADKPAFRAAFRYRRCLVVADGFYEWKGRGRAKQPFFFRMRNAKPFGFAGLWEHWSDSEGSYIETCTIITTEANSITGAVHDRMPVILHPEDYDRWLESKLQNPALLESLLRPYPSEEMVTYPVSPEVNSPSKDEPEFIKPLEKPIEAL